MTSITHRYHEMKRPGFLPAAAALNHGVPSFSTLRTFMFLALACLAQVTLGAEKLAEIIEKGIITREVLNTLTYEDVPRKWRTKIQDESTDKYTKKVFYRGKDKILEVLWGKEWTGTKSNIFTATVYDGKKRIGKIICFSDGSTNITQGQARAIYLMNTTITKDGKVTVSFMSDAGYYQSVQVKGRDSCLLDDLEYTKNALMVEKVGKPLLDAIDEEISKSPKKAAK